MDNYIIFYEGLCGGPTDMRISESPAIIQTDDISSFIEEREKKYECKYRYYSNPQIYQRDIGNSNIESIMTLNRFSKIWSLQDTPFRISALVSDDEELNKDLEKIEQSIFETLYPKVIDVFKKHSCIISNITCYRDTIGIKNVNINANNGHNVEVYLVRKDQSHEGKDQ